MDYDTWLKELKERAAAAHLVLLPNADTLWYWRNLHMTPEQVIGWALAY
jgi:hypothetical protein